MDTKRAAADVLYMLGDNSTHSMVIIPKAFEETICEWLDKIDEITSSAKDANQHALNGSVTAQTAQDLELRWRTSLGHSRFFADFSPELQKLLWTSRDKDLGTFRADTVNVVRALLGNNALVFAFP